MKKHPYLQQALKVLKPEFHVEFIDYNIITIATDKNSPAFANAVVDPTAYDGIILSLSLDYSECYVVAELVISLMYCCPIIMGEGYYVSKSGDTYFGQEAFLQHQMEYDSGLLSQLTPETDTKH